ncbi:hypothetical protein ZIOFF_039593 [Zingiber officinale]|uniref:Uncharacterized protein n=1 Tax=Zingiber officinale TaxID=94328 RepID=A0A8J5G529_ZINOF|nr:hypothetical protein ZIOFF_039593 [Zingiber officinale]
MVLSALGQMRGGKEPKATEKALVTEAKERLVVMCEAVKPKDLVSTEAVRVVVEDLGLNRSKDPALGFQPPRMSIAEKLMLTKKKVRLPTPFWFLRLESRNPIALTIVALDLMFSHCRTYLITYACGLILQMEVSKETNVHSSVHSSQQLPVSVGAKSESRGTIASGASRISQDKSPMPTSSGSFHNSSTISHVPVLAWAAPNLKPSLISDAQAGVNTIKHSSSSRDKALPSAHNGLNARPSGPSYLTHDQAENPPQKIPTISSMQSPSVAAVSRFSQPNKLLDHTSIRSKGIAGANASQSSHQMINQEIKSSTIQAGQGGLHITHQPTQGLAFFHAPSLYTNHNEIGKSVQRILQLKVLDHPNWIPPSSDYMNASLNCQICKNVISDTESLLVCDAYEKGNHLKCLQSYGSKDIPKAEWHCPSCLASSNGKTLPPKYGRVTRAPVPAPRAAPNTSINVASKKTEDLDPNTSRRKALANNNSYVSQHSNSSNLGGNHYDSMVIGAEIDSRTNGVKRDNEKCDAVGDHLEETNGSVCANSDASCGYPNDIENDSGFNVLIYLSNGNIHLYQTSPHNLTSRTRMIVTFERYMRTLKPLSC